MTENKALRIAIITGASSGMGKEFAGQIQKLYKNLDEIWIIARRNKKLKKVKKKCSIPVRILCYDLLDKDGMKLLKRELRKCQIEGKRPNVRMLVNGAGFGKNGPDQEISEEIKSEMIQLNCQVPVAMIQICLPYMSRGSRIVNLVSAAAFCPQPDFVLYAATKSFLLSYSRGLAAELKAQEIYVTAVCPGPVATAFFKSADIQLNPVKEKTLAHAKDVVHEALVDSYHKKQLSIYGMSMKAAHILSKAVPSSILINGMQKINKMQQMSSKQNSKQNEK